MSYQPVVAPLGLEKANQLWRVLQGPEKAELLAEIKAQGPDGIESCLLGLAALLHFRDQIHPFHEVMEAHICAGLKERGVQYVSSNIYKKLGMKFAPIRPLDQSDLDFIDQLPSKLRETLLFVPMIGDATFDSIVQGFSRINTNWYPDQRNQGRDTEFMGKTQSGDRWLVLSKLPAEGSCDKTLDEARVKIPDGFKIIPAAEAAIAILLHDQSGYSLNDFYRKIWARVGDGSQIICKSGHSQVEIRSYDPLERFIFVGLGICKDS